MLHLTKILFQFFSGLLGLTQEERRISLTTFNYRTVLFTILITGSIMFNAILMVKLVTLADELAVFRMNGNASCEKQIKAFAEVWASRCPE